MPTPLCISTSKCNQKPTKAFWSTFFWPTTRQSPRGFGTVPPQLQGTPRPPPRLSKSSLAQTGFASNGCFAEYTLAEAAYVGVIPDWRFFFMVS